MSEAETIEQKYYRLCVHVFAEQHPDEEPLPIDDPSNDPVALKFHHRVVELAIAEEREANDAEIKQLKDVISSYEKQPPVAWINRDGTYVELSIKSTVYGSHTIPLIMQHEDIYLSKAPEIFSGTLSLLNRIATTKPEVSE